MKKAELALKLASLGVTIGFNIIFLIAEKKKRYRIHDDEAKRIARLVVEELHAEQKGSQKNPNSKK